jgi:hypothetical protein
MRKDVVDQRLHATFILAKGWCSAIDRLFDLAYIRMAQLDCRWDWRSHAGNEASVGELDWVVRPFLCLAGSCHPDQPE